MKIPKIQPYQITTAVFILLAPYGYYDATQTTASYHVGFFQMLLIAVFYLHVYTKNNRSSLSLLALSIPLLAVYSVVTHVSPFQYGVALLAAWAFYYVFYHIYSTYLTSVPAKYKRYIPALVGLLFILPYFSPLILLVPSILGIIDLRTLLYLLGILIGIRIIPLLAQKYSQNIHLFKRFPYIPLVSGFLVLVLWSGIVTALPNKTVIDASTHQSFTLSTKTKKTIRNIRQNVEIRVYVSDNTPLKISPISLYATTFIEQYESESNGKIDVTYIDPETTETQKYLDGHDVSPIGYKEQSGGKEISRDFYLAAEIYTPSKSIFIPQLLKTQSLEYQLTSAIHDIDTQEQVVGLVGFPSDVVTKGSVMYPFYSLLKQQFHIETLGPTDSLSGYPFIIGLNMDDSQLSQLESQSDGKSAAILFQEAVHVSARDGNGLQADSSIATQSARLTQYGIQIHPQLVLSKSSDTIAFANSSGSFYTQYPFAVRTDHIIDQALSDKVSQGLVFPWVSRLTIHTPTKNGWKTHPLVVTTDGSWTQSEPFTLFPSDILMPPASAQRQELVGAYTTNGNKTIVVIPTTYFLQAPFIGASSGNYDFMFALLRQFKDAEFSTSIHAKDLSSTAFAGFSTRGLAGFILSLLFGTVIMWRTRHL